MHGLVRELALQVYKNICNIFKLGNLLHITQEVGRNVFHIVSSQTTSCIAWMQYMYDCFLRTLCHTAILDGEGTIMKMSTKCNRCYLFQTMSELSAWLACCHTDWLCTRWAGVSNFAPPVHKTIYSDCFIWFEKAFLTCPMDLVSNRISLICIFVQVSPASYEEQRYMTHWWEVGGSLALSPCKVWPWLIRF